MHHTSEPTVIRVYGCGCVTVDGPTLPPNVVVGTLHDAVHHVRHNPAGVTAGHYPCTEPAHHDHPDPPGTSAYRELVEERFRPRVRPRPGAYRP